MDQSAGLTWLTLGTGPAGVSSADIALLQAAASVVAQGGRPLPLGGQTAQSIGLDDITVRGSGTAGTQVVAFGKRLSDKIYIEYEQGLATTNNIVRLSYILSRTVSLTAETRRSSGAGVRFQRSYN